MNVILCTKESQEDSLMHYRLGGEKKGVRRWQNKDGSYTPAGYKHYAEMYGWGKRKRKAEDEPKKSERQETKEQKERVSAAIQQFNKNKEAKVNARIAEYNERRKRQMSDQQKIRTMSDDELDAALARLQKEKQLSSLMNEREQREKGPIREATSRLVKEAAENLARKSLNELVDATISKAKTRLKGDNSFKLSDYMDVDPASLDSEKLKAVSEAFNQAANLVRNRSAIQNEGGRNRDDNADQNRRGNGSGNDDQNRRGNDDQNRRGNGNDDQNNNRNNNRNGNQGQRNKYLKPNGSLNAKGWNKYNRKIRTMLDHHVSVSEIARRLNLPESAIQEFVV